MQAAIRITTIPVRSLLPFPGFNTKIHSTMLLQFSGITLIRGNTTILDNIHWAFEPGQQWVIMGSNGSGKTSLLNVILAYEQATSGRFMVFGHPFGSTPWDSIRSRIGIVSLAISQRMEPAQSAQQIVAAGKYGQLNRWDAFPPQQLAEANRWLYLVGIEQLANRPWSILSQGERQRVMIARALILQPKLLVLDEPCAGLDPVARERFLDFLQNILTQELNIPTLLITHHVEEIMPLFTHLLLLRKGHVLASGTIRNTLNDQLLSQTFGAPVSVIRDGNRYRMLTKSGS
jgi:iron complex transport system ATP-binding protein